MMSDAARIAELEAEVARLKEKLAGRFTAANPHDQTQRAKMIWRRVRAGEKQKDIAKELGVTPSRVSGSYCKTQARINEALAKTSLLEPINEPLAYDVWHHFDIENWRGPNKPLGRSQSWEDQCAG